MGSSSCYICNESAFKEYKVMIDGEERKIFLCNRCLYHVEFPEIQ